MHLATHQGFYVASCFGANRFQLTTTGTNNHAFLAFTLDQNKRMNMRCSRRRGLKLFYFNRGSVWQFFAHEAHYFFTNNFSYHESQLAIVYVVFWEIM